MTEIRPVRIGIMSFAHMHASNYASVINRIDGAELAGIADDNPDRGKDMANKFKTRFFESYDELLRQDIHAVVVCSENVKHKEHVIMAAEAGKHILCEKPLCTTIEDGKEMVSHCKRHGVRLQTSFPSRFSPVTKQVKDTVQSGQIGKVLAIKGTNRGKLPAGWYTDPSLSGGGAVMDHTVHVADLIRWITGSEIVQVYAEISDKMHNGSFDDTAVLSFSLDDGVFATLDPSWSRPESYPFWGDVTMTIIGTDGAINMDLFKQRITLYSDQTMRGSWEHWGDDINLLMMKSFVSAISSDSPVEVTGEDGLAATAVVLAAYQSAERGIPVKVTS